MLKAVYSPNYYADTSSTSMRKLPQVAEAVLERGLAELVSPENCDIEEKLKKLHNPRYVDSFLQGIGKLASSSGFEWTPEIMNGVLAINSGQLLAAKLAVRYGMAANIAQGFHHATYNEGSSYCTFNGLALVAQENPNKKVFVLDCDEHEGNGTHEFCNRLSNLYNFSINGTRFDAPHSERGFSLTLPRVNDNFQWYLGALDMAFDKIQDIRPDLIIYQAGVDCHQYDPLGTVGLTSEQLRFRDSKVFNFAKSQKIPIFFVLAGGYQESMANLVDLHLGTFESANLVYNQN
jgi:acetoin utilization deacetylase AcuC-like enzyme